MKKILLLLLCIIFLIGTASTKPLTAVDLACCHGFECPRGTVACVRNSSSTPDKRHFVTRVECRDARDVALLEKVMVEKNHTPGTLRSYSHMGNFILP